jgi:hypothetical protein
MSSTCASSARTCPRRTPRPCSVECRPSDNSAPPLIGRKSRSKASRSRQRPTERSPLSPQRLSRGRSRPAARAMAKATESSPMHIAPIQIFSASIVRCRPMRIALPTGGRALQSEVGLLPLFLYPHAAAGSPVGPGFRGPVPGGGESGLKCATSAPRSAGVRD